MDLSFTLRRATGHQHCLEVQALRWYDQVVETMAANVIPSGEPTPQLANLTRDGDNDCVGVGAKIPHFLQHPFNTINELLKQGILELKFCCQIRISTIGPKTFLHGVTHSITHPINRFSIETDLRLHIPLIRMRALVHWK